MFVENNPFTPSFGRIPPYMAGRKLLMNDFAKAFRGNGNDPYLQTLIVGTRGTGKTALLTQTCDLASGSGWVCANVTCGDGLLDTSESIRIHGVTIGQIPDLEWEQPQSEPANWRTRMTQLLEELSKTDTGLVIAVDEVRAGVDEMEQVASTFQHFVRERRRVALLMAGLPHQASQLVSSEAVSFSLPEFDKFVQGEMEADL